MIELLPEHELRIAMVLGDRGFPTQRYWPGMSMAFVYYSILLSKEENVFDPPYYSTAKAAIETQNIYQTGNPSVSPYGSFHWLNYGTNGHVMIHLGKGRMLTTGSGFHETWNGLTGVGVYDKLPAPFKEYYIGCSISLR